LIAVFSPVSIANSIEDVANNDDIELVIAPADAAAIIAVCRPHFIFNEFQFSF